MAEIRKRSRAAEPSTDKFYKVNLTAVGEIGGLKLSPRDDLEVSAAGLAALQEQGVVGSFEEIAPPVEGTEGDGSEV